MATTVAKSPKQAAPTTAPPAARKAANDKQTATLNAQEKDDSSSDTNRPQLDPNNSRNLLVILHGKRVEDDLLRNAITDLKEQGHQISVRVTFDKGDVDRFVSEAVSLNSQGVTNYQTIVAGGGDGTLNEVVCALMKHKDALQQQGLAVALLPLGTANDFACVSGVSVDPYAALVTALDPSTIHTIDVAAVNDQHFMNIAVAGSLAESSQAEVNSKWKRLLGPAAIGFYVFKRLLSSKALEPHRNVQITFCSEPGASPPGNSSSTSDVDSSTPSSSSRTKTVTADLLMLAAGNSRQMGRRVNVCPDALLDDGLLDFTLLTGNSLTGEAAGLLGTLASAGSEHVTCDQGIAQLKASWLEVKTAAGSGDLLPFNRDGEPEEATERLLFQIYPKALQFHMPDNRMLTENQLETASSVESVASISDIRGNIVSNGSPVTAAGHTAEAPAGAPTADGKQHKGRRGRHRRLKKRTLQRMVVAVQPEGQHVRKQAQLAKLRQQLGQWAVLVLFGAGAGWLAGVRNKDRQSTRDEQHAFVEDGNVPSGGHSNQKQMHGNFKKLTADAKLEKARLVVATP